MTRRRPPLSRRAYLATVGGVSVGTSLVAGCLGDDDDEDPTGELAVYVGESGNDIDQFDSYVVTMDRIRIRSDTRDETRDLAEPIQLDLVEITADEAALLDEWELVVGEFTRLDLSVDLVSFSLDGDGVVTSPGDPRRFDVPYEVRDGQRTAVTLAFGPLESEDNPGVFRLRPVEGGTTVE